MSLLLPTDSQRLCFDTDTWLYATIDRFHSQMWNAQAFCNPLTITYGNLATSSRIPLNLYQIPHFAEEVLPSNAPATPPYSTFFYH
jgi:hypothetical protein